MTKRDGLMPDDVEWLEKQLVRMEAKLDSLSCGEHGERLAACEKELEGIAGTKNAGRSKGSMIIQAIIALGVIASVVLSIIALTS